MKIEPILYRRIAYCLTTAFALLCGDPVRAEVDYLKDIKPVFKARCYACHGARKQKADLRLDTVALIRRGSKNGDILSAEKSRLLERVTTSDKEEIMPPQGEGAPLSSEVIGKIRVWLAAGAQAPSEEQPELDPRQHWVYQSPKRAGADLDTLLARRLGAKGFKLQAEASREVWLRRVFLDLIGLPPTAEEVRAFLQVPLLNLQVARAETVNKLLESSTYGERWARHFMDIWRYSDWYGLDAELRNSQKHIWHWRDWIIESVNADKGYDRMIQEMLAGDELEPENPEVLRATGFLARSYYIFNRTSWLDDVIEHTSRAFLGTTLQCAKCHDHKFDPIEQVDYYRLRAIFEPYHVRLDAVPGVSDFEKDGLPRVFDFYLDRATYRHVRGDEKNEDKSRVMTPGVPSVLGGQFAIHDVTLPLPAYAPGMLQQNRRTLDREASQTMTQARMALASAKPDGQPLALKQLEAAEADFRSLRARTAADEARWVNRRPEETLNLSAARAERQAKVAHAQIAVMKAEQALAPLKADAKTKPEDLAKFEKALSAAQAEAKAALDTLAKKDATYTGISGSKMAREGYDDNAVHGTTYPAMSTGRRLAFARWMTATTHPLTARVLVNHVWTRHFGASLVPDVSDFGLRCPPPLHQDVLDTLAVDFMEHGWSLKHLHRQMVLSQLYLASSSNAGADAATLAADPDNAYYWRMNPRRLESQAVRDALLAIAGKLDFTQGGPGIDSKSESSLRRALYFLQTPDTENRFLGVFDNANVLDCYRRQESIVPQQALALTNSKLTRECAEALSTRLIALDDPEFVKEAFLTTLGRWPTSAESEACFESLGQMSRLSAAKPDAQRTRALFLQALISHNDFITLR